MKKVAVYCGTSNIYPDMVAAAKSLVANSSVEKIYFLVEDNEFSFTVPSIISVINVGRTRFFLPDCPNLSAKYTHMALLKAVYPRLLGEEVVLHFDVDTVCVDDIDGIWDADIEGRLVAAVPENDELARRFGSEHVYYSTGVMLMNLSEMWTSAFSASWVGMLHYRKFDFPEQDSMNMLLRDGEHVALSSRYNEFWGTEESDNPAIIHFAGSKDWQHDSSLRGHGALELYRNMTWNEAMRRHNGHRNRLQEARRA